MSKKKETAYAAYAKKRATPSRLLRDCLNAFWTGGLICTVAQGFFSLYSMIGIEEETVKMLVPCTIILITAILTGIGVFDKIAKTAGAGTLVPISGFANAVVSPAIDSRHEGLVLGVGAKVFVIAGPVILYGTLTSVIYGVLYFFGLRCFGGAA